MKNLFKFTFAAFAIAAALTVTSCDDASGDDVEVGTVVTFEPSVDGSAVLSAYANDVVVARYVTLATASKSLYDAVLSIDIDGTDEASTISAACTAWKSARIAWERTEAYLFGPVDSYGIDPGIDSWPLNLAEISASIVDYTDGDFTDEDIQSDGGDLKGFHAIEFLLFNDGSDKAVINEWPSEYASSYSLSDLSKSEVKSYLEAITKELYRSTTLLVAEWDNSNSALAEFSVVYTAGDESDGEYLSTYTSANNSSYGKTTDALSVILEAAAGIADEVGAAKIADPIKSGNVLDVESWFSHNSVVDFTNNIIGIKEAYYGVQFSDDIDTAMASTATAATSSISAYVASGSETLDAEIKAAIETAIVAVDNMPAPFRNYLTWSAENLAAQAACSALCEVLETAQMAVNDGYYVE